MLLILLFLIFLLFLLFLLFNYFKNKNNLPLIYPIHIGIIMDGNGRWATRRNLPRIQGHVQGTNQINNLLKESIKISIKYITLYCLSTANLKRPEDEINGLYKIMENFIIKNSEWIISNNINVKVIGNISVFPLTLQNGINNLIDKTKNLNQLTLILALNYDSRTEICDAAYKYALDVKNQNNITKLNWDTFNKYLYTSDIPDPDLIIRTSGEYRISNFLLMQSANAEYIFLPILWPDFTYKYLMDCIVEYNKRERRFGLTSEQIKEINKNK